MKIKEILPDTFDFCEALNTKADVLWSRTSNRSEEGSFTLDGIDYVINIDSWNVTIDAKRYDFVELGFTGDTHDGTGANHSMINGVKNSSMVLGIVYNAGIEKVKQYEDTYDLDGIVLGTTLDPKISDPALQREVMESRHRIYAAIAKRISREHGYTVKSGIPLANNKGKYVVLGKGTIPPNVIAWLDEKIASKS